MTNYLDLTGQVAVVTGAGTGIGKETAKTLAACGAKVVLLGRRIEKLEETQKEIEEMGGEAFPISCDVTKTLSVESMANIVKDKYGTVDILVNNAGVAAHTEVTDENNDLWEASINLNIMGIKNLAQHFVPLMKDKGYGRIVNIASVNAIVADKGEIFTRHAYNMTKAAVLGLTKGMACTYAKYGITVNAVCPGLFKTEMTENTLFRSQAFLDHYNAMNPTSRPGELDEVAYQIVSLCSTHAGYTTGQAIVVDGGGSLV